VYAQTKYGIVISDPDYYAAGMLTQRYWEYCLNGMVAFVDDAYDKSHAVVAADDFVRVKNSKELQEKIDYLEAHPDDRAQILAKQRNAIDKETVFMKTENAAVLQRLIFSPDRA
jgi:spore maturation protein CgeB